MNQRGGGGGSNPFKKTNKVFLEQRRNTQMGHQLNQKVFFQNGEMTAVLLQGENARSSGPGMMFQKTCKKHYGDSSNNITFSLLRKNNLAKMLQ
jgi:hypothetical protein